jgi:hypothetical protein
MGGNSHQRKMARKADDRLANNLAEKIVGRLGIQPDTLRVRLLRFWRSTPVWGVLGILAGAALSHLTFDFLFVGGWIALSYEVIRARLFSNRTWTTIGNSIIVLVLGVAVMGVWKISPRPKDPPTLDQQFDAFAKRFPWLASAPVTTSQKEVAPNRQERSQADLSISNPRIDQSLRTRSSVWVRQMYTFLDDKHSQTPDSRDTLPLFREKFGDQLAALRDGFAQYGLSDHDLNLVADPGQQFTASDEGIKRVLDSINNISKWLPVEESYKGMSDSDVAARTLSMVKDISERVSRAFTSLSTGPDTPDGVRFHFSIEYKKYCFDTVRDLRGVSIKRLGPPMDADESLAFSELMEVVTDMTKSSRSIAVVRDYVPYLRKLGNRLTEKSETH